MHEVLREVLVLVVRVHRAPSSAVEKKEKQLSKGGSSWCCATAFSVTGDGHGIELVLLQGDDLVPLRHCAVSADARCSTPSGNHSHVRWIRS